MKTYGDVGASRKSLRSARLSRALGPAYMQAPSGEVDVVPTQCKSLEVKVASGDFARGISHDSLTPTFWRTQGILGFAQPLKPIGLCAALMSRSSEGSSKAAPAGHLPRGLEFWLNRLRD
jgi:hypothetical protein